MTLGQNIQTARRAKGLSQEALAERIGVSRQALGKWEKDTALPGLDNLQALAAELGTGVDALLGAEAGRPRRACRDAGCTAGPAGRPRRRGKRRRRLWELRRGRGRSLSWPGCWRRWPGSMSGRIAALNQNYAAIQSSYAAQQAESFGRRSPNCRTPCGWARPPCWTGAGCPPTKLHRDADKSWMPMQVQVTSRARCRTA